MDTSISKPYKMLARQSLRPREPLILTNPTWTQVEKLLTNGTHFLDLETTGLNPREDSILGIGLANSRHVFYVDFQNTDEEFRETFWNYIPNLPLVAHNTSFDAAFIQALTGQWPNFIGCSLVLFKMLANEGWTGQTWGLDVAISEVLGWPQSNKDTLKDLLTKHKLPKNRMSELAHLEPEAFAMYCAMDAEACRQLWEYLVEVCDQAALAPILGWHQQEFMNEIRLLVEQQLRGLYVDKEKLHKYSTTQERDMNRLLQEFTAHPLVAPHITEFNETILQNTAEKEPPKHTKTGKVSSRWTNWQKKMQQIKETQQFNINSKPQMAWLFYERIYATRRAGGKLYIDVDGREVMAELTATGQAPVYKKLLPRLGEPGQILAEYNRILKESGYVKKCLEKTHDNVLRFSMKAHGTVTGRLSGEGGFNAQQQSKTQEYLECWKARPGHKIVQLDFSAVEPVVLTNATQDKVLMSLYGPESTRTYDIKYLQTLLESRGISYSICDEELVIHENI